MKPLTWGLAIATYDRADELCQTVEYALQQTRPPSEVVIADSTSNWESTRDRVAGLIARIAPDTRLQYLFSTTAQQTVQRNIAIDNAAADVLFMIDDDAYLRRDAAELVMRVYESDERNELAAVGIGAMEKWEGPDAPGELSWKHDRTKEPVSHRIASSIFGAFTYPFSLPYKKVEVPKTDLPLDRIAAIEGFQISVRRDVARKCHFDEALIFNWAEDGDATARFAQEGAVTILKLPLLYHVAAPRANVDRRRGALARFAWIMNFAYLNRKFFGGGLYVRLFLWTHWLRWVPFDLLVGIVRRDFSRLKGCFYAFRPLMRMTLAKQSEIGGVLREETIAIKARLQSTR